MGVYNISRQEYNKMKMLIGKNRHGVLNNIRRDVISNQRMELRPSYTEWQVWKWENGYVSR